MVVLASTASTLVAAVMLVASTTTASCLTSTTQVSLERCADSSPPFMAADADSSTGSNAVMALAGWYEAFPQAEESLPLPHCQPGQVVGSGRRRGTTLLLPGLKCHQIAAQTKGRARQQQQQRQHVVTAQQQSSLADDDQASSAMFGNAGQP